MKKQETSVNNDKWSEVMIRYVKYKYKYKFILLISEIIFIGLIFSFFVTTERTVLATQKPNNQEKSMTNKMAITSEVQNGLSFENKWVEVGVPLTVENVPEDAILNWVITSPDGSKQAFSTNENYYTPKVEDEEKLITVSLVEDESLTASIYFSSLPVVYINNELGYNGVGEDFSDATMGMQGSKSYTKDKQLYRGEINIKLRDKSAKSLEKRPFNIKLGEKANLLGLGMHNNWELLSNDIDHTLLRNKLLYEFSKDIGMEVYLKSENVVLVFNNVYYGVYQLCEPVNIDSEKVDIYNWEDAAGEAANAIVDQVMSAKSTQVQSNNVVNNLTLTEDEINSLKKNMRESMCKNLSWITSPYTFRYDINADGTPETYIITDFIELPAPTGGVLLEMDSLAFDKRIASSLITNYAQPFYFKEPQNAITNYTLYNNIKTYIQSFEHALHSADFAFHDQADKYMAVNRKGGNKNSGYQISDFSAPEYDGKYYSDLFDMDSLVQNFIVSEFSMNWDSMKNNVIYKDIDGLFHMGPVSDFEWAWGNINRSDRNTWFPTQWYTTSSYFAMDQYYQSVQWNRYLIRDPYFLVRVYESYKKNRTIIEGLIKEGGKIDTYSENYRLAAAANDAKWGYTYEKYQGVGFEESIVNLKDFITARVQWLDEQMESLDTLLPSLGYYSTSTELSITKIDKMAVSNYVEITARVLNPNITSVTLLVNGSHKYIAKVKKGQAVCKIPAGALVSSSKIQNVIQIFAMDKSGNCIINSKETGNYSLAKSNYATFYFDKNIDGIKQSVNDAVTAVKKQTSGYNILLLVAGIVCVAIIVGIVMIAKSRKN